jgi:signal transduction histidine kinase/ActR/RegA family two-component response regulator
MNPFTRIGHQSAWFRYGIAIGTTLIALMVRLWFDPVLGRHIAFAPFTVAVMLSAALCGSGPGVLATLLGALAGSYFWRDPRLTISVERSVEAVQFLVFLVIGSGINIFARTIKNAQHEAEVAKGEAEQANQAKDHFLAMLSHELRTPLGPILLSASAMEGDETIPSPIRKEFAMISRNVDLETRLIDDLLDVTRISKGKLQMHESIVDAHKLLAEAVVIVRYDTENKGVSVTLHLNAEAHHVCADPARLHQVFWNLIKNAVKFTEKGGSIDITSENRGDAFFVARIADTGIGIASEVLPKIFNAFEQGGDARTRRFGGLGLGLTITKGLVELHGGNLSATSAGLGKGTTMVVELPVTAEREAEVVPAKTEAPRVDAHILVVEDDQSTAQVMSRLLKMRGYHVETAGTIAEARNAAIVHRFDILLSDLSLPDGSGLDLLRELKNQHHFKGIALNGFGMDSDIQASLDAGFSLHLTKPINIESLDSAIRSLCASASDND